MVGGGKLVRISVGEMGGSNDVDVAVSQYRAVDAKKIMP